MSIAAAVEAALAPKYCKFGRILADLPADDKRAILDGLNIGLTPTDTARILAKNGHPLSEKAIRTHRISECCCQDVA
jgi:hypothetical protein